MAIRHDISFFRGEDVTIRVTVTGENITGWALTLAIGRGYTPLLTKTIGSGITITNGGNGIFEAVIADTDTDTFDTGGYVWDAKRTDAGQEAVLTYGKLSLEPNVAS